MPVVGRKPLKRLPATPSMLSRYLHPHGYVIECEKRGWSEPTGRMNGQADHPPPMYSWTVFHHVARRRRMLEGRPDVFLTCTSDRYYPVDFDTLRDARAWCDEHPRDGWADAG